MSPMEADTPPTNGRGADSPSPGSSLAFDSLTPNVSRSRAVNHEQIVADRCHQAIPNDRRIPSTTVVPRARKQLRGHLARRALLPVPYSESEDDAQDDDSQTDSAGRSPVQAPPELSVTPTAGDDIGVDDAAEEDCNADENDEAGTTLIMEHSSEVALRPASNVMLPYEEATAAVMRDLDMEEVKSRLAQLRYPGMPELTVLEYIENGGSDKHGSSMAERGRRVLEDFSSLARNVSIEIMFLWRYLEGTTAWTGHEASNLRSREAYYMSLADREMISLSIAVGASTYRDRRRLIETIDKAWGADWFDRIPRDLLPQRDGAAILNKMELSKGMLEHISYGSKRMPFSAAYSRWSSALQARVDPANRVGTQTRTRKAPKLTTSDFAACHDVAKSRCIRDSIPEMSEDPLRLAKQNTPQPRRQSRTQAHLSRAHSPKSCSHPVNDILTDIVRWLAAPELYELKHSKWRKARCSDCTQRMKQAATILRHSDVLTTQD